jgi:MAP/microtubule affinity-regulating kinase
MKQKRLNTLRTNILTKNSTTNTEKKEKILLNNLCPNSLPIKHHNISTKNDELLMKKKIFNYNKNSNYMTVGNSYINSLKKINKEIMNLKYKNIIHKEKDNSVNTIKKNYTISKSIDNSIINNNSKELFVLNKKNNLHFNKFINFNFSDKNSIKHNSNTYLNKIKEDIPFLTNSITKNNKNIMPELNISKISLTNLNSRKTSAEKKSILSENGLYNIDFTKNENRITKSDKPKNYRKNLIKENMNSLKNMDEYQKEIMEIINEDKIKNKGIYHLYQNNVINQKKKMKSSIKYPSFNSLNHKGINNNLLNNNSNNSNNAPLMVFAPSLNNNIKKIKKVKGINETISLLKNTENTLYKIFLEKPKSINNNNKINFSDKKHINHLEIFSQNNTNKMWNNNNFSYLNNISNAANDYDSINKLAIKKSIINNKTDFLINNQKEINSFNRMIENYANHSNNNKGQKISKKKLNENKETIITNQVNEIVSTKQMSNESKTPSINSNTKNSKTIEKSDNMLDNISEISRKSTIMKDSKYYMNKSQRLIEYIKDYYNKNKKSYPETKINFYLYGRPIGQGAFGKVNLGLNVLTGRVVAIKSFKKRSEEKFKTNMKKVLYETDLMKRFNHPNITKILEVFHDEDYMLIIMEYINGGNLFSFVKKRRKLNEKMAKFLFRQIILGIKHIHSQNIVHRDIKLENILIDLNNNIKICDFGIGKILESSDELLYDRCGTPMYMAPEILLCNKKNGYSGFPVDIWASGITLYIMLSGTLPYNINNNNKSNEDLSLNEIKNKDNKNLQLQIINFKPKKIKNISKEANNLLNGLLNKNPDKRLKCDEILNHPWLKNINFDYSDNNKYHLFTKAEMTMMTKTYIDYRKGNLEDLRENFTITNLKCDEIKICEKNVTTKSTILDPFNSAINNNKSSFDISLIKEDKYDDFNNSTIKLENDLIIFNNKVKEFNLNYEINNNQEVDNGMLINTKTDNSQSSSMKNNSFISHNDFKNNKKIYDEENDIEEKKNIKYNNLTNLKNDDNDINQKMSTFDVNDTKVIKILNEIENFGYKKEYVIQCLKDNILCHATTVYYLLNNYGEIE